MDKNVNLEEISKMPNKEFQKHFQEWLERDDVARSLQAKLRKDLIDNFNKTSLGKKMYSQHIKSQRMILSPLILAINALVAEFLYAQNCHFSLSVFCTEIPYRNTTPDFESGIDFRFNETELTEILEAISVNFDKTIKTDISMQYLTSSNEKFSLSLLHIILKNLFKSPPRVEEVEQIDPKLTETSIKCKHFCEKPFKGESKSELFNMNYRYLNKYLMILSRKVKEMSNSLEQLEKRDRAGRKSVQSRKFENLNRSLDKVSYTLRQLSLSKRKNKTIATIVSSIDSMAKQFERCAENIDNIADGYKNQQPLKCNRVEKSYTDWVRELQSSENGKKFMDKLESAMKKTINKEKDRIEQVYNLKLETQRDLIKLKYKQKLYKLKSSRQHSSQDDLEMSKRISSGIAKKIKEFEQRHQDLVERIQLAEEKVRMAPESIQSKVLTDIQMEAGSKMEPNEYKENQYEKIKNVNNCPVINKLDKKPRDMLLKPQMNLQEMVKSITAQERHIDHIVFDAKLRIQELEFESNQIDRNFQDYLERQKTQKTQMEETATSIWKNYTIGKSMLNEKCKILRHNANNISRNGSDGIVTKLAAIVNVMDGNASCPFENVGVQFDGANLNIPNIRIDNEYDGVNIDSASPVIIGDGIGIFENPFRKLKEDFLNKNNWKTIKQKDITETANEDLISEKIVLPKSPKIKSKTKTEHKPKKHDRNQFLKPPSIQLTKHVSPKQSSEIGSSELDIDSSLDGFDVSPSKSTLSKGEPQNIEFNNNEFQLPENSESNRIFPSIDPIEQKDDYGLSQFILDNAGQKSKTNAEDEHKPQDTFNDNYENLTSFNEVNDIKQPTTTETQESYTHKNYYKDYNKNNNNQDFKNDSIAMANDDITESESSSSISSQLELSTGKYANVNNSAESDFWN